ncbi:F0F1 ATP synthase subunit B family protein [Nocardia stercoris]|uniref:ATP synthase subunit b n=1 Tax=Nocardia stercoris TaxID=2483361 RepID=A0A3M2LCL3_9NOCA|nr:hypothetical protein [Nocardia stercoris]RMI35287.1 hypothetical protein EBN03_03095 [Nocardia stercoris]
MKDSSGLLAAGVYHISIEWPVFISQLFGFAVILFVIMRYVAPVVRKAMAKTQDAVAAQLADSTEAAARLASARKAYESAIAEAQKELEELRADAQADAEFIIAQMRDAAAEEVERVRRHGREQINQYRRQLVRDLTTEMTLSMLERTEEKVRVLLAAPQSQAESVDRFIHELESLAESAPGSRRNQSRWN